MSAAREFLRPDHLKGAALDAVAGAHRRRSCPRGDLFEQCVHVGAQSRILLDLPVASLLDEKTDTQQVRKQAAGEARRGEMAVPDRFGHSGTWPKTTQVHVAVEGQSECAHVRPPGGSRRGDFGGSRSGGRNRLGRESVPLLHAASLPSAVGGGGVERVRARWWAGGAGRGHQAARTWGCTLRRQRDRPRTMRADHERSRRPGLGAAGLGGARGCPRLVVNSWPLPGHGRSTKTGQGFRPPTDGYVPLNPGAAGATAWRPARTSPWDRRTTPPERPVVPDRQQAPQRARRLPRSRRRRRAHPPSLV